MTILNEKNKITYVGETSQVLYPISFEFIDNGDIVVSIYNLDDTFVEDWVYSTQYIIEDSNVKVLEGYKIDSSKKILIRRLVDYIQDNKYREGGDFPAKSTETSFDKLTMLAQQLKEELGRCPKVDPIFNLNITLPAPDAGKALIWNDGEDGFKNSTVDVDHLEEVTKQYRDEAEAARDAAKVSKTNAKTSEDSAKAQADRAQGIADAFDANAEQKTQDFNANAAEKTDTFNQNAAAKQAQVDAGVDEARKWAIGTEEERPDGSSKHWAEQAKLSADSVDADKIKRIGFENNREIECNGNVTVYFQDTDEIVCLKIVENSTVTFDFSQVTFPKIYFTVQVVVYFSSGVKTVTLTPSSGIIVWINGNLPDFSSGKAHWLVIRNAAVWNNLVMSDAGEEG